jgi:hypothetical protein
MEIADDEVEVVPLTGKQIKLCIHGLGILAAASGPEDASEIDSLGIMLCSYVDPGE